MRSELALEWDLFELDIPMRFKDLLRRLKQSLEEVGVYLGSQL